MYGPACHDASVSISCLNGIRAEQDAWPHKEVVVLKLVALHRVQLVGPQQRPPPALNALWPEGLRKETTESWAYDTTCMAVQVEERVDKTCMSSLQLPPEAHASQCLRPYAAFLGQP